MDKKTLNALVKVAAGGSKPIYGPFIPYPITLAPGRVLATNGKVLVEGRPEHDVQQTVAIGADDVKRVAAALNGTPATFTAPADALAVVKVCTGAARLELHPSNVQGPSLKFMDKILDDEPTAGVTTRFSIRYIEQVLAAVKATGAGAIELHFENEKKPVRFGAAPDSDSNGGKAPAYPLRGAIMPITRPKDAAPHWR